LLFRKHQAGASVPARRKQLTYRTVPLKTFEFGGKVAKAETSRQTAEELDKSLQIATPELKASLKQRSGSES